MRIALVSPTSLEPGCGIGDHGHRLAEALAGTCEVLLVCAPSDGRPFPPGVDPSRGLLVERPWASERAARAFRRWLGRARPDAVLIQHAPHLESRRGRAVWSVLFAAAARGAGRPPLVYFHEIGRPLAPGPRALLSGAFQRAVATALLALAGGAFAGSAERVPQLRRLDPTRRVPVELVPIGSNVRARPASAAARAAVRAAAGIAVDSLVLVSFGRGHETLRADALLGALERLIASGLDAHLAVLGAAGERVASRAAGLREPLRGRVHAPGFLDEAEVSAWLGASDLFLLPLADGASSRRGTLAAALEHGLAVLSTRGPNTDPAYFAGDFVRLVDPGDPEAFAAAALELATDPAARAALGEAGRLVHARRLAWPVLAGRIEAAARRPPRHRHPGV